MNDDAVVWIGESAEDLPVLSQLLHQGIPFAVVPVSNLQRQEVLLCPRHLRGLNEVQATCKLHPTRLINP